MPLYIAQSGDLDRCYRCLTDWLTHWQTLKDRATQLLTKYKSGALVKQFGIIHQISYRVCDETCWHAPIQYTMKESIRLKKYHVSRFKTCHRNWALAFHNLLHFDHHKDCFGNAKSCDWRWKSMYSIALKNDSLIIWECGKMSMENVEIFSWGSRSLSTESSPPPFQRLQANQIVPLTCICLVFFIPLLHICLVFFTQYFSRQRLVTDYCF